MPEKDRDLAVLLGLSRFFPIALIDLAKQLRVRIDRQHVEAVEKRMQLVERLCGTPCASLAVSPAGNARQIGKRILDVGTFKPRALLQDIAREVEDRDLVLRGVA